MFLPHNIPKRNLIVLHLAICCKSLYKCGQESNCGYMWTWKKGRPSHHFGFLAVLLISSQTALLVNGIFVFLSLIFLFFFLFKWEMPWDGWRDKWNERQKQRMKRSWLFVKVVYKGKAVSTLITIKNKGSSVRDRSELTTSTENHSDSVMSESEVLARNDLVITISVLVETRSRSLFIGCSSVT